MDMKVEPGLNFDPAIIVVGDNAIDEYEDDIRALYLEQPASWEGVQTIDGLMKQVFDGDIHVVLLREKSKITAMATFGIIDYGEGVYAARWLFLNCKNFYHIAKFYGVIEYIAQDLGMSLIEATAHPALAEYACKKLDYRAPGVFIQKDLRHKMRN